MTKQTTKQTGTQYQSAACNRLFTTVSSLALKTYSQTDWPKLWNPTEDGWNDSTSLRHSFLLLRATVLFLQTLIFVLNVSCKQ